MKKLFNLSFVAVCLFSAFFFPGCSSGDEPKPFDCNSSDLDLSEVSSSGITNCALPDGEIKVIATGGKEPYTYKIGSENFQNNPVFPNLMAGTYSVTVKDENGCEVTVTGIIVENSASSLDANVDSSVSDSECNSNNGEFSVSATGGMGPYEFNLGGVIKTTNPSTFSNLSWGEYNVTVKDAEGCSVIIPALVENGTGIDYDNDMLPLFQSKCNNSGCHPANGNWFDYNTAKSRAAEIKARTASGDMPRTGSLTAQQKADIACWVDNGAPKN